MVVKRDPSIKPCIPLGVIYFWFMTGKCSWVHSRTHGLFPFVADDVLYIWLLQVLSPPYGGWRLDHGHDLLCYLIMILLLDMTMKLACIWTKCVWGFPTTLLPLFVNSCCNNYVNSDVHKILVNYLWNGCNMWLVMLNHVWSWLYVSWFEILCGFSWLLGLYGFKYDCLIAPVIAFILVLL